MKTMTRRPVPDNNLIKSVRKLGPLCGLSGPALVIVLLFSWFLASCGTVSKQSQPLPPDFGLSTSPGTLTIAQGSNGARNITLAPPNDFTRTVAFSASPLPNGVIASFSPHLSSPQTTMTAFYILSLHDALPISGPALVIVLLFSWFLASCGTVSKQSQPLPPDFGLSASPSTLAITQGSK